MEKKKNKPDIELTELFMVKADWHRTFMGKIERFTNPDGTKYVTGKVFVQDGDIWGMASDKFELSRYMDSACKLKLDYDLHGSAGVTSDIAGTPFNLN